MDWEQNIELRDAIVRLKNSAEDKEFWKKFISQVANDETFAFKLIFALESELQDRHYRKENGRDVGKKT